MKRIEKKKKIGTNNRYLIVLSDFWKKVCYIYILFFFKYIFFILHVYNKYYIILYFTPLYSYTNIKILEE